MWDCVRAVLVAYAAHYGQVLPGHPGTLSTLTDVLRCMTEQLGGQELRCPDGHELERVYKACKQPVCPCCKGQARRRFVREVERMRLDCPVMQIVVTLPKSLREVWAGNRRLVTDALFDATMGAIAELMADPAILGVMPGIIGVMHTKGRAMATHVHIHLAVTRGGLAPDGTWKQFPSKWVFPYGHMSKLVRGKMLDSLTSLARKPAGDEDKLYLPRGLSYECFYKELIEPLYGQDWNVYFGHQKKSPERLIKYLSKGAYGGPIGDHEIVSFGKGGVTIRVERDAHDGEQSGESTVSMSLEEFGERWLAHVMPKGFKRVRYRGLYASSRRSQLDLARLALHQYAVAHRRKTLPSLTARPKEPPPPARHCETCGQMMQCTPLQARPRPIQLAVRKSARPPPQHARDPTVAAA